MNDIEPKTEGLATLSDDVNIRNQYILQEATARAVPLYQLPGLIETGQCVLFLGAGSHYHSPDSDEDTKTRPPTGDELADILSDICKQQDLYKKGFTAKDRPGLQKIAQFFDEELKRNSLVKELESHITFYEHEGKKAKRKPSKMLQHLAEMPFTLIITTNYDVLFEEALRMAGKTPIVGSYKDNKPKVGRLPEKTEDYDSLRRAQTHDKSPGKLVPDAQFPFLYKIHGVFEKPDSIVITEEDYIHFVLRMRDKKTLYPVPDEFNIAITKYPTLFLGYGLRDYNLRLLFRSLRWGKDSNSMPMSYSIDPYPDYTIMKICKKDEYLMNTVIVVENPWHFLPDLYEKVMNKKWQGNKDPQPDLL